MQEPITRYNAIDAQLFQNNRRRLAEKLAPNAIAIFHSNDIMPKDGDDLLPFKQNSDLFYLTGIDQEETTLILYPDAPKEEWKELLFVRKTSPQLAIWEGNKYTQEGAHKVSAIANVHWQDAFPALLRQLLCKADTLYLNTNEHLRATLAVESKNDRFIQWCQKNYPLHNYRRLAPIMAALRAIKSPQEIALIRQACEITHQGFLELLPHVRPQVMEYELEASLSYSFLKRGSRGFGYPPIIASGAHNNVLHYIANSSPCQAGELILIDAGAEYGGYNADMTRVIPVNGRFTPRQKALYNAVLNIMQHAKKALRPTITLAQYHQAVVPIVEEELIKLKLLTPTEIQQQNPTQPAYKKYFMHGLSHHLGIGVHDFADMDAPIAPHMVFTIEPGIYIPEEKMGVRLENCFVVQEDGSLEDLMAAIPLSAEAIENAMHS